MVTFLTVGINSLLILIMIYRIQPLHLHFAYIMTIPGD